jgi:hypothetical protein
MLMRGDLWNLVTSAGRVHIIFQPAGTDGFADLEARAVRYQVFGAELRAASLEDIIRSKEASDRPQDRSDVVVLRELVRRQASG